MDEKLMFEYQKLVCVAEMKLYKAIDYQFNIILPTNQKLMEKVFKFFPKKEIPENQIP